MNRILIFAGTTEGRKLSECLSEAGIYHTVCVATEYGETVLRESRYADIHTGRMDADGIRDFIISGGYIAVVDATHPYAKIVTDNIKSAMEGMDIPYIRLRRSISSVGQGDAAVRIFESADECAAALKDTEGNILLTTGSKELGVFAGDETLKERLYVRVLPGLESLRLCDENGITGRHVLALQGPFTTEMNMAMIGQYDINILVTKISGSNGGYEEKVMAAKNKGISVYAIGCPVEETGYTFNETLETLSKICDREIGKAQKPGIILAGVGMGSHLSMTEEVREAVCSADILLGAERMIAGFTPRIEKKPYYDKDRIIPYIKEMLNEHDDINNIVILFSGDTGFYSGAAGLYDGLLKETESGALKADIKILPGISSVSYLSAKTGISYDDGLILSIHGKEVSNLLKKIKENKKTFLLLSGVKDINRLGSLLSEGDLKGVKVIAGYRLSYDDEKIMTLSPAECMGLTGDGLYTAVILNDSALKPSASHGMPDSAFIRDKVPMTKEEIREISICKLNLKTDSVLYDIGSGTGSIAIEAASLSDDIKVYAIEKKDEAVKLINANKNKSGVDNIEIIKGTAPECLGGLSVPTHAFIGGSSGNLKDILNCLKELNPRMRVVINAISIETVCEIKEVMNLYDICNDELVQVQVSRADKIGSYNLMKAENPVWIFSFDFGDDK